MSDKVVAGSIGKTGIRVLLASLVLLQGPAVTAAATSCPLHSTSMGATLIRASSGGSACDHSLPCKLAVCCSTSVPALKLSEARVAVPTGMVFAAIGFFSGIPSLQPSGPPAPPPKS